jgi:hypothetical protein
VELTKDKETTMNKLSSVKVAEVLAQVPQALRALSEENQSLKEKIAHYERRDRVTKIASQMTEKNLNPESSMEEKIASLMSADDLDAYEKAIELSAPQVKLAALHDDPGSSVDAESNFLAGLMND